MTDRRLERMRVQRRLVLERLLEALEHRGWAGVALEDLEGGRGLRSLDGSQDPRLALCFHDHTDYLEGFQAVLDASGLAEACMAMARHMQEDRDHLLRRAALVARISELRAEADRLEDAWMGLFRTHFRRWGAADAAGQRAADLEAAIARGAVRGATRLWEEGNGRPVLPVVMQEALAAVWPALYRHLRRS